MEPMDELFRSADLCLKIRDLGLFCKITDVAEILKDIDVASIFDHYFNVTTYVLWDKKSAISGVSAQEIINTYNMKDENEAFSIFSDGSLVTFHITAPDGSGSLMTKEQAEMHGERAKNTYVVNRTNQQILNTVCEKLIERGLT